ncbi:DUF3846 domain-containing protein [Flaviflexus sp.]|uniref:DUF3846 domain-containing protein n=1 Tax=Flaviflexus sp. TaxID=1969482 RepID=UPI003F938A19
MTKALKITTAGQVSIVTLNGLADYQAAVDGYIEVIPLNDGHELVINEEGKLTGAETNPLATILAFRLESGIAHNDYIVGDAVIVQWAEDSSEWVDVSEDFINKVLAFTPVR